MTKAHNGEHPDSPIASSPKTEVMSFSRNPEPVDGRYERLRWLRPTATPGSEILAAQNSFEGWHMFHERYAICACDTAAAGWRYRSRDLFLSDGSVMLIEPGEIHRNTRIHKHSDFIVLFVDGVVMEEAARELGLHGAPHFRFAQQEADGRGVALSTAISHYMASLANGADALEQQSRFAVCLGLLLQLTERASRVFVSKEKRAVECARRYLLERYDRCISLDELCAVANLSRFHLLRAFARRTGLPPHAYQTHVRVERAAMLLRGGTRPAIAAQLAGFADQSHFTRHFKRIMRTTPREYFRGSGASGASGTLTGSDCEE